jgi:ParB family chromosome partitioning protein
MTTTQPTTAPVDVPVASIIHNPENVRVTSDDADIAGLADSIFHVGLINPLTVMRTEMTSSMYTLVAGHRRHAALQSLIADGRLPAGSTCPVIVLDDLSAKTATTLMLVENLQRLDIRPIDEAKGYQRLVAEYGLKPKELAKTIGKSLAHINDRLALLGLPEEAYDLVGVELPLGQAVPIAKLRDAKVKESLVAAAKKGQLAEYQVQSAVRKEQTDDTKKAMAKHLQKQGVDVIDRLEDAGVKFNEVDRVVTLDSESIKTHVPMPGQLYMQRGIYVDVYERRTAEQLLAREVQKAADRSPWDRWCDEMDEYEERLADARKLREAEWGSFLQTLRSKTVARHTLVASVVRVRLRGNRSYSFNDTHNVCRVFGLAPDDTPYNDKAAAVKTFIADDTNADLVFLLQAFSPDVFDNLPTFAKAFEQHLTDRGIDPLPEVPEHLRIEPWQDADGVWITDRAEDSEEVSVAPDEHLEEAYEDRYSYEADDDGQFDDDPNPYHGDFDE